MARRVSANAGEANSGRGGMLLDSVLFAYSEILFARHRVIGLLFLVASVVRPPGTSGHDLLHGELALVCGLGAILIANGLALLLKMHPDTVREGFIGYNALLVGLAVAVLFEPSPAMVFMLLVSVVAVVFVTTGLRSTLGYHFNLPVLSLPFLLVIYLALAARPVMRTLELHPYWLATGSWAGFLPVPIHDYLCALGAVLFAPNVLSGALILVGLLVFSRYAVVLTMMGFIAAWVMSYHVFNLPQQDLFLYIAFNFMLTSLALGGVWFVPQRSSLVLALGGVLICAALLAGASGLLADSGLPVLILPFNLTMLLMLPALRQRTEDTEPKSVDFVAGSPEANRDFYKTRLARFGTRFAQRLELPFRGTWTCTQGVDGPLTHRGPWRHGFDFEVTGAEGALFAGQGQQLSDYYCWKLPVLACGAGKVVRVVDNVPDNEIGEVNTQQNWGNLVMIEHAIGLYSVVCHLAEGSVQVSEGALVRSGDVVGLCGNSGRSPQPHLHIQMQGTQRIGAPTVHGEFQDVVVEADGVLQLEGVVVPDEGQRLRRIDRQEEMAALFRFPLGRKLVCAVTMNQENWREVIETEMDLYGNLRLVSSERKATLFFENRLSSFLVIDYQGPLASALFPLACALSRVPLEETARLGYTDVLPLRHFLTRLRRLRHDLAWGRPQQELRIQYRTRRRRGDLVISGQGDDPNGGQVITEACFREGQGALEFRLETGSNTWEVKVEDDRG